MCECAILAQQEMDMDASAATLAHWQRSAMLYLGQAESHTAYNTVCRIYKYSFITCEPAVAHCSVVLLGLTF